MKSFYDQSRLERILLEELYSRIYTYDIKYYHSLLEGYDTHDSVVLRFEKDSPKLRDTHIYEAKIRDRNYPSILLEKKKLLGLIRYSKRYKTGPVSIFYVSSHPEATWVFKLSQNLKDYNWIKETHNVSTREMYRGTTIKEITYLDIKDAKRVDIKSTDIEKIDDEKEKEKKIENVVKNQLQTLCLYEFLTKKDDGYETDNG